MNLTLHRAGDTVLQGIPGVVSLVKKLSFALLAFFFLATPHEGMAEDGILYIGSSTISMGILEQGAANAFTEKTGIPFKDLEHLGSGRGIDALLAGTTELAGASRPLRKEEKDKDAVGHTIGYDAIAVFVHRSNPVDSLTKDQLEGIFTGRTTNWRKVGGEDLPITPNTEIPSTKRATYLMFQKIAMDGSPYAEGFSQIDLPRDQLVHLAGDRTGICTVSLGLLSAVGDEIRSELRVVSIDGVTPDEKSIRSGSYLVSRPLLLVTRGVPRGNTKRFIEFMLSGEGQGYVAKNFTPVRR
ncbi:phosphate ABC transporter substrate-binding protein [Candidatus Moduliflexota bacterium]